MAAPAISSLVSLYREKCEPILERKIRQREIRALFRNAALSGDPADTAYSTPRPTKDFVDGAGILTADNIASCATNGADYEIDLAGGVMPPAGGAPYQASTGINWAPPDETQSLQGPSLDIEAFSHSPASSGWRAQLLTTYVKNASNPNPRIRFTISWDACGAVGSSTAAPGSVPVDLDLFIRRRQKFTIPLTPAEYVWGSQSTDDNNEGFDYVPSVAGTYDVYVMWPEGSTNCDGGTKLRMAYYYL